MTIEYADPAYPDRYPPEYYAGFRPHYQSWKAESFEALREGAKRKRKPMTVYMPMKVLGDFECGVCGGLIREPYLLNPQDGPDSKKVQDDGPKIEYYPKTGTFSITHYYCGWGALLEAVFRLADHF